MIVDLLGIKQFKTDKKVKVLYDNGNEIVYNPKEIEYLLLNDRDVTNVQVLKDDE